MGGAAGVLLSIALLGASPGRALLDQGIEQFEARDFSAALGSLTSALDERNGPRTRARIHVYIGLIQVEYKLNKDAQSSFAEALERDPKARLPRGSSRKARQLFSRVRKAATKEDKRAKKRRAARRRTEPAPPKATAPPPPPPPPPVVAAPPPPRVAPPPPPPPPLTPPLETSEPVAPARGPNVPAWVMVGVSGAALITAGVLGGVSASTANRADQEEFAGRSQSLYRDAVAQRTGAFVSLGVGAIAGGLATYFFVTE